MYRDEGGEWTTQSFAEVGDRVRSLALGLIDLGVQKGDKVSILANTRPEWTYYDFAALTAGAIVVPIYQTNSPEECQYVLENSDAKVVIVEDYGAARQDPPGPRPLPEARARDPHDRLQRRRDLDRRARRARRLSRGFGVGGAVALGRPRRHLHVHLHVRHHRPAQGLRDLARQLPRDAQHVVGAERAGVRADHLPLPAARPLVRAPDPAAQLRRRRRARLLGARPAEDPPQPGRGQAPLLPLRAADLREDLHRRDLEGGERGRPAEGDLQLGGGRRPPGPRARAPGQEPLAPASHPVRDRRPPGAVEHPQPVRRADHRGGLRRRPDQPGDPSLLRRRRSARARGLGDDRDLDRGDDLDGRTSSSSARSASRSPAAR